MRWSREPPTPFPLVALDSLSCVGGLGGAIAGRGGSRGGNGMNEPWETAY